MILGLDAAQPPHRQPSAFLVLGAIDAYQATLSKLMPSMGVSCRFEPTCSHYGEGAIRARGTWVGAALTARRLVRCGPWTPAGTVDPPPEPRSDPHSEAERH
ncbi:MAG: membrane protein insertion efficiency factor YidD [Acidobacteriota bacterium]